MQEALKRAIKSVLMAFNSKETIIQTVKMAKSKGTQQPHCIIHIFLGRICHYIILELENSKDQFSKC